MFCRECGIELKNPKLCHKCGTKHTITEIMEYNNKKNYSNALKMNVKSFTVHCDSKCCELCKKTYEKKVFDIKEIDKLPPLHDKCSCVALFSTRPQDGSSPYD